jgi:DNA polymerase V
MVEKRLSLDDFLITHPASTFFVRAAGTSMEGAHIVTDDVLVVDRSAEPVHGAIVVAALAGELVVKRIRKKGAALALVSENPTYAPIPITEESDCVVWGVVIGVVRKL